MNFSKLAFATITLVSSFALAGDPKAPAAPAAAMPTAPDELVAAGKAMSGSWNCKGNVATPDGKTVPMNGTYKNQVELSKFWVHGTFTSKMDKNTFQFEEYTTYDAGTKMWKRVWVSNDGGMMWGTAKADPTKQEWDLTTDGPHGQGMMKDTVDLTNVKTTGVAMKGQMSMDKGKTWIPVYDMVCKK